MPNWCSCCLRVKGPSLDYFYDKMRDKPRLSFSDFYPVPAELANVHSGGRTIDDVNYRQWRERVIDPRVTQEQFDAMDYFERHKVEHVCEGITAEEEARLMDEHGAANTLDWQRTHWGVKWDACEVVIDHMDDQSLEVRFDTPWCPPSEWVEKVSEDFPTLEFELAYAEGGMGFWGVEIYQNGGKVDYAYHEDNFWKPVDECDYEGDEHDRLAPLCARHIEHYGLHTGG
jgi:hypothetical protein